MNAEEKLTREEIAKRIVTGMGMVYELFNEMNSFFRSVLDALESSELDILPIKKRFILPKPRKRSLRTAADDYLKTDMGFIALVGAGPIEDEDTVEDEEDGDETELEKKGILINPDSQFLAIRAILYHAEQVKTDSFDPVVVAALLSSVVRWPRKKSESKVKKEKEFRLKKSGHLFRTMGQLEPSLEIGKDISWMIPKYSLSANITGVVKSPLVAFDSEQNFGAFVDKLILMGNNG